MSDPASPIAAAAQSLRETAKWLVGGVVATAAGVFAGSSLTTLGTLGIEEDGGRLALAAIGIVCGFGGLALILAAAIRVLTRDTITMIEIAAADPEGMSELGLLHAKLIARYRQRLPPGAKTFQHYVTMVDQAVARGVATQDDRNLLAKARADDAVISADAAFLLVRGRFDDLVGRLYAATPIVVLGLGLFAWAANPPPERSTPPAFSFSIELSGR